MREQHHAQGEHRTGKQREPPGTGGEIPHRLGQDHTERWFIGGQAKAEERDGRFMKHRVGQSQNRTDKHLRHDGGKQMRHRDTARADAERAALCHIGTRKDGAHLGT